MQKQIKIKERKIIITKQSILNCLINEQANQYLKQVYHRCILWTYNMILFYSISCCKLLRNLQSIEAKLPDNIYLTNILIQEKFNSHELKIYDLTTALLLKTIKNNDLQVLCCTISKKQELLVTSNIKGKIILWNLKSGQQLTSYNQQKGYPYYLKFNHSETILYSYSSNSAQGFDVLKKQIVWKIELNSNNSEIHIDQKGKYCFTTLNCLDTQILQSSFQIEDLETGDVQSYFYNQRIIKGFSLSNNDKYVLIVSNSMLQVYDRISTNTVLELEFGGEIFRASFCLNGICIIVTTYNLEIQFYNLKGECVKNLKNVQNLWIDILEKKFIIHKQGQCGIWF